MHAIAKFIYFKLMGWKLIGSFPDLNKCIVAVVPHTSWVDFFLGLLVRRIWQEDISFLAKKSLFKPPFGWYIRWMGAKPIVRNANSDLTTSIAAIFKHREVFKLALSPEGTRKKVSQLKTGFYYIAKKANIPIVLVTFDYGHKQVKVSSPYFVTENMEEDFNTYKSFYKGAIGKVPENSFFI